MTLLDVFLAGFLVAMAVLLVGAWRAQAQAQQAVQRNMTRRLRASDALPLADLGEGQDGWLALQVYRARIERSLLGWAALLALGFVAVLAMIFGLEGLLLGPLAVVGLGALLLRWRIERNATRLAQAMPVFLDRVRQHLLIGASVPQALQRATVVSPAIVRWVFEPVERRLSAGGELVETLEWAARRQGGENLATLAAAFAASSRFGGRLSEALNNLALMERRAEQIRQEMRAATAEVRASSVILATLPAGVGAWLLLYVPNFADYFLDPERGRDVLYMVGGLYLTGLLLLRQIAQPRY